MDITQYFSNESEFMKASDIPPGKQYQLIISGCEEVDFAQQGESPKIKPVLAFQNAEKKLALNKTNGMAIAHVLGNDMNAWIGKPVNVYSTKVDFGGKMVDAIRVDMPRETVAAPAAPDLPPAAPDFDDDLPF